MKPSATSKRPIGFAPDNRDLGRCSPWSTGSPRSPTTTQRPPPRSYGWSPGADLRFSCRHPQGAMRALRRQRSSQGATHPGSGTLSGTTSGFGRTGSPHRTYSAPYSTCRLQFLLLARPDTLGARAHDKPRRYKRWTAPTHREHPDAGSPADSNTHLPSATRMRRSSWGCRHMKQPTCSRF